MGKRRVLAQLLSLVFLLVLWLALARAVNAPLILPYPRQVLLAAVTLLRQKQFWLSFAHSAGRVLLSFGISVTLGAVLGFLSGRFAFFRDFLELPLALVRSVPVVAVILLALFWFSSSFVPVFVAVLMTLPIMTDAVCAGMLQEAPGLSFMAGVFRFSRRQEFLYIRLPQLLPFFRNALHSVFGLTWKVVAAGEVLSLPRYGLGSLLQGAQVHLETARVMAVSFLLVLTSVITERLLRLLVR